MTGTSGSYERPRLHPFLDTDRLKPPGEKVPELGKLLLREEVGVGVEVVVTEVVADVEHPFDLGWCALFTVLLPEFKGP